MNRTTGLWMALLLAAGCGKGTVEEARAGLPEIGDATIPLPGDDSASGSGGLAEQPLLGQRADMYGVTRVVTGVVNLGVVWALGTIRLIAALPPTSHAGNTFTWGPSKPQNLAPKNNFKLTVTKNTDGSVSYDLMGKKVDEADTAWRSLMSGTHAKGATARSGKGTFRLDHDAAHELDSPRKDVGAAEVTYGFEAATGYQISVAFKQVRDGNSGRLLDANYRFQQPVEGAGSFEFTTEKDLRNDGKVETLLVHSRWTRTGKGRSDIKAMGGSLTGPATISECWDDTFARNFASYSYDLTKSEGVETSCAFEAAAYATP